MTFSAVCVMVLYVNWDGFANAWYRMARLEPPGTPNLDRLVAGGTVLTRHFCGIPAITNPMQQTLVSGAWPQKTGNCYRYFDRETRRVVQTGRLNPCETIAEAAVRRGLACASVHGWYEECRGCRPGDAGNPYIAEPALRNFEGRVQLLLDYLGGKPVPSSGKKVTMQRRPDYMTLYADDIDTVCHNGARLPYAQLRRAKTLEEWYGNLRYTVQRMDRALGRLMDIPGVTLALAADHGGMPYGAAGFGVDAAGAARPRLPELLKAIREGGIRVAVVESNQEDIPADAQAALLVLETQAQLTWLQPVDEGRQRAVCERMLSLPFVRAVLDRRAQRDWGAWAGMCDLFIATRPPYFLRRDEDSAFVGGSHASLEDTVLRPFCAFWGAGIRQGCEVTGRTSLIDFAPTVCRLLGIEGPRDADGRVLTEVLEG